MSETMPEFDQVQQALEKLHAMTDASEAHGTLCGLLLGQKDFAKWIQFTVEAVPDSGDLLKKEQMALLQALFEITRSRLNAEEMDFELLLPDEGYEFSVHLLGLATWCQGFLYGVAASGEAMLKKLSEQGLECMDDILKISQMSHDDEQDDEAETVFAEIVEHVRLSVIYLNEELNPVLPSPPLQ